MPRYNRNIQKNPTSGMRLIARIHKGTPKNEKGHSGRDTDHFRFALAPEFDNQPSAVEDDNGNTLTYNQVLVKLYGEQPRQLNDVSFLGQKPSQVFDDWYEEYGGNNLVKRRCNGIEQVKYRIQGGGYGYEPTPCIRNAEQACECVPRGRLTFTLLDFAIETRLYGYFMLGTGSEAEMDGFNVVLESNFHHLGNLRSIMWTLERAKSKIPTPKKDKNGNVVDIIPIERWSVYLRPSEAGYVMIAEKLMSAGLTPQLPANDTPQLPAKWESEKGDQQLPVEPVYDAIDVDKFIALLEPVVEETIHHNDVMDSFTACDEYPHTYAGSKERAIAMFAWYWSAGDYDYATDIADMACQGHELLSATDAKIELEIIQKEFPFPETEEIES